MPGAWTVTRNVIAPLHTFTASEEGWLVTSHIIELPSQLLVVDAQYTLSFAREVVRYATGLNKPLTRLYVTHYHPDHLLGAAAFDAPLYALESVAGKIDQAGDRVAREEHEKVGDDIPTVARQPDRHVARARKSWMVCALSIGASEVPRPKMRWWWVLRTRARSSCKI
jgi:glyoxylase-like metal-dependent hydrolase (beta-lactamase superfamily II)